MKFLTQNILLIGLALGSGFMLIWPLFKQWMLGSKSVTPAEAVTLINRSHAIVIDVREDTEFVTGHVTDARNIPLAKLEAEIANLARYKDKPIIVNCQGGVRSAKACELLHKHEFSQVYNLGGGIRAWQDAKLPVVKS